MQVCNVDATTEVVRNWNDRFGWGQHVHAIFRVDSCQVDSATFYANVAAVNGGGIFHGSTPGTLTNTLFNGNKAQVTVLGSHACQTLNPTPKTIRGSVFIGSFMYTKAKPAQQ